MHRTIPPLFALLHFLSGAVPEAQPASTGRVSGHVTLTRRVRGTALPSTAYPARSFGRHDNASVPEILNVVVYVKDPGYRGPLPSRRVEMRQENETFIPRTLTVTKGSTVD